MRLRVQAQIPFGNDKERTGNDGYGFGYERKIPFGNDKGYVG